MLSTFHHLELRRWTQEMYKSLWACAIDMLFSCIRVLCKTLIFMHVCVCVCASLSPSAHWGRKTHKPSQAAVREEDIKWKQRGPFFFLKSCPLLWRFVQHPGAAPVKQQGRKTTTPRSASRPVWRTTPALHHCIKMPLFLLLSKGNSQTHIKTYFSIFSNTASSHARAHLRSLISFPIVLMPWDYLPTIRAPPPSCPSLLSTHMSKLSQSPTVRSSRQKC